MRYNTTHEFRRRRKLVSVLRRTFFFHVGLFPQVGVRDGLLAAVLVVFIAPSVDLPATALRAQQNAQCIMLWDNSSQDGDSFRYRPPVSWARQTSIRQ